MAVRAASVKLAGAQVVHPAGTEAIRMAHWASAASREGAPVVSLAEMEAIPVVLGVRWSAGRLSEVRVAQMVVVVPVAQRAAGSGASMVRPARG